MFDLQLIAKINSLPAAQRNEISDLVDYLYEKYAGRTKDHVTVYSNKGFIKVYSDFYEPIEGAEFFQS